MGFLALFAFQDVPGLGDWHFSVHLIVHAAAFRCCFTSVLLDLAHSLPLFRLLSVCIKTVSKCVCLPCQLAVLVLAHWEIS